MRMLRISKLTDYAILIMVELTRRDEMLSAHALAERVGVEVPTASKVLKLLTGGGLLHSYRGANGGYKVEPFLIDRIEDLEGNIIFQADPATACLSLGSPSQAV